MKNPFRVTSSEAVPVEQQLGQILGRTTVPAGPATKPASRGSGVEPGGPAVLDEDEVLGYLAVPDKAEVAGPELFPYAMFNSVRAEISERQKEELEQRVGELVYYQTPETHTIRKESSPLYAAVFANWRKGVIDLFCQYRTFCFQGRAFAFLVHLEGVLCFFHTPGYNGCQQRCCEGEGRFALLVSGADDEHFLILESPFEKQASWFCLSGKSVLFVLDTIVNLQASLVHSLPFVLSKHFFFNSIATRPAVKLQAERNLSEKRFNVKIEGWVMSMDLAALQNTPSLVGKILKEPAARSSRFQR